MGANWFSSHSEDKPSIILFGLYSIIFASGLSCSGGDDNDNNNDESQVNLPDDIEILTLCCLCL